MADILLIEDDSQVRELMQMMLEKLGHTVRSAEDGDQGVALFEEAPAPFVVTDLLMPQKEGLETIRDLRRLDGSVKILAISGGGVSLSADGCLELARKLGADAILSKPFSSNQLEDALGDLMRDAA